MFNLLDKADFIFSKPMKTFNKWLLWGLLVLFTIILFEWGLSYFWDHSYYGSMFTGKNFGLLISALVAASLPIYHLYNNKKTQFWSILWLTSLSLGIFSLLHEIIWGTLVDFLAPFLLLRNTGLLLGMGIIILFSMFSLGSRIVRMSKLFSQTKIRETLLSFGVGLVAFLVVIQILMGFGLFYWPILWGILIACLVLARFEKPTLKIHLENFNQLLETLHTKIHEKNTWIWILLLACSLAYFYFGFNHTIIPYPTARDANHEYLYTPKVIADNFGIIRWNQGTANAMPYLWHGLIASAFSFWKPISVLTSLSADSFAINMNFWSGILVLIFWIALIIEVLKFFNKKDQKTEFSQNSFFVARGLLLAWLTSGMGAFLLFVDNKTDMGVLSLSIMAIFAGFSFINLFYSQEQVEQKKSRILIYLIISAVFFAFSVMAKPTAFIDLVIFVLIMIGLWINTTSAIGVGIITIGTMGILQPLYASAFTSPALWKIIIAIGAIIFLIWIIRGVLNKKQNFIQRFKNIALWGIAFMLTILLFKAPRLAYQKAISKEPNWESFPKNLILGYQAKNLIKDQKTQKSDIKPQFLATLESPKQLEEQDKVDLQILDQHSKSFDLNQCKQTNFDDQELSSGLQTAPGSTLREDFGRYVGFNSRTFKRSGTAGLILKLLFRKDNTCYGLNQDALLLCRNRDKLNTPSLENLTTLKNLFTNHTGKVKNLIESGFNLSWTTTLDNVFSDLSTYYQEHSILTTPQGVNIPYRYLVPINAVFNWSLQNLSSYYTDIGLIWIFALVGLVGTLCYSLNILNKKLILFISAVGIWRIIRWTIAAGIIRYWLGLMIWLLLGVSLLFQDLENNNINDNTTKEIWSRVLGFLVFLLAVQLILNFLRIGSQAGTGPFGRYKSSTWKEQRIWDDSENPQTTTTHSFASDNVFDLQFGQYSPLIKELKNRKDEDGVLIAGTYIQYFLHNQKNITLDGLLSHLREQMSDYNSCKTYHRLKNNNIKYLVIDPNIWTVGRVWAGNESLFHRFFAKLDNQEKQIQTHGAMTMLARFAQDGYLKLFFTNNIGAKYAFSLTNEELKSEFWSLSDDDLILIRAKLAVAKFFITQQDTSLLEHIIHIFVKRIATLSSPEGLDDLTSLLNKKIDAPLLLSKIQDLIWRKWTFSDLSDDEKLVLSQYLAIIQIVSKQQDKSNIELTLQNIFAKGIQESIFGNSQIIALEML